MLRLSINYSSGGPEFAKIEEMKKQFPDVITKGYCCAIDVLKFKSREHAIEVANGLNDFMRAWGKEYPLTFEIHLEEVTTLHKYR